MRYHITHRTVFTYGEPAYDNVNEVRLSPVANPHQALEFFVLKVIPATRLKRFSDLYSNPVHHFEISHPHHSLSIESQSIVSVARYIDYSALPYGCHHSNLKDLRSREECCEFLSDSRYVQRSPKIWREAVDVQDGSTDVFQTAYALMKFIYDNCAYLPGLTDASTTAADICEDKQGVCQDFAHLLIVYCRSLGIPCRYVSGYIWDPGSGSNETMRGAQASHAWAEIYLPTHGWIGLDPTNNKVVNEQYVVVATGRDYDDVAPVRGTFYGGGLQRSMEVVVKVKRMDYDEE